MTNFLTVFFSAEPVHLYKDVGMIPYHLAKYCAYNSTLLYVVKDQEIICDDFEKYVRLLPLKVSGNILVRYWQIFCFIYKYAKKYNVINFYGFGLKNFVMPILFKVFNRHCKIYIKLDLGENGFNCIKNTGKWKTKMKYTLVRYFIDIVSVETKSFYFSLKNILFMKNKLIYLPNGMFIEPQIDCEIKKKNIILTVGRIGTPEKNNELLVKAIEKIPIKKIKDWQVYFVGSLEEHFKKYITQVMEEKTHLRNVFIMTGNIGDKKKLYSIYAQSKIFCLTSRWESFGLVLPEAMYFQNYVISTDFPAAYDLLDNERVGKIIANENANELINALEACLDGKVELEKLGQDASEHIKENFNWKTISKILDGKIKQKQL